MQFFYSALLKGHFSSHLFDKKGIQNNYSTLLSFSAAQKTFKEEVTLNESNIKGPHGIS